MPEQLPLPSPESLLRHVARHGAGWPAVMKQAVSVGKSPDPDSNGRWLQGWQEVAGDFAALQEDGFHTAEPPPQQLHRVLCDVVTAFDHALPQRVAQANPGDLPHDEHGNRLRLRGEWLAQAAGLLAHDPGLLAISPDASASCTLQLLVEEPSTNGARRAVLHLRLMSAPGARLALVPSPASAFTFCTQSFQGSLQAVTRLLRRQLADAPGGAHHDTALQWDIHTPGHRLLALDGPSAGAALAVAALWLLQGQLPEGPWKTALAKLPYWLLQSAGLSIAIDENGHLAKVGAARQKAQAYTADRRYGEPLHLFLHPDNHGELDPALLDGVRTRKADNLTELLQAMAQAAAPVPALAAVMNLLPLDSAPEDDDKLPPPSTDERSRQERVLNNAWDARGQVRDLRDYMLVRWAHWARQEGGELHMRFVPLSLVAAQGGDPLAPGLPQVPMKGLSELLKDVYDADTGRDRVPALLLRGAAGAGKSTLLQRHEQALCLDYLRQHHRAGSGAEEAALLEVPLYVRLASLPPDEDDPVAWLREQVRRRYPECQPLHELLKGRTPSGCERLRLRLLLDGLNELPEPPLQGRVQRADQVVDQLCETLRLPLASLLSSRGQHGFEQLRRVRRGACVEVQPWTADLVLAFVRKCFSVRGAGGAVELRPEGEQLLQALGDDRNRAVLALCSTPFNAAGQVQLWAAGRRRLVSHRADLYLRLLREALLRELKLDPDTGQPLNPLFHDPELLTAAARCTLQDEAAWARDQPPDWPADGALLPGLFRQSLDQWLASNRPTNERGTVELPWDDPGDADLPPGREQERRSVVHWLAPPLRDKWRQAVQALGLLAERGDGGAHRFAFKHQSWGEYLASVALLTPSPNNMPEPKRAALLQRLQQGRAFERSAENELAHQRAQADALWWQPDEAFWKQVLDEPLTLSLSQTKLELRQRGWTDAALADPDKVPQTAWTDWQFLVSAKSLTLDEKRDTLVVNLRSWGDPLQLAQRSGQPGQPWWKQASCVRTFLLTDIWTPMETAVKSRLILELGESQVQALWQAPGGLTLLPVGGLDEVLGLALLGLPDPKPWLRWLLQHDLWSALQPVLADLRQRLEPGNDGVWAAERPHPVLQHLRRVLLLRSLDAGPEAREPVKRSGQWKLLSSRDEHCDPALAEHWAAEVAAAFGGHDSNRGGRDLRERLQAGRMLGVLGDNLRYERAEALTGTGLRMKAALWASVGKRGCLTEHRIGSEPGDPFAWPIEQPAFWTDPGLPYYQAARLPVTCAEWRAFVLAGGYDPQGEHWEKAGSAAQAWLQAQLGPSSGKRSAYKPAALGDSDLGNGLNPMTTVTVFEAVAYAAWAAPMYAEGNGAAAPAGPGRWVTRLPSEVEWEAAMRRPKQRRSGAMDFNHSATGWLRPSPVGIFSRGYGAAGQADARGNVWEWCSNALPMGVKPYDANQRKRAMAAWNPRDGLAPRALRGGAYGSTAAHCLPAVRNRCHPGGRGNYIGLRLLRCWLPYSEP